MRCLRREIMNTATIKFAHNNLVNILVKEIIRDFKLRCQKDIRINDDDINDYTQSRLQSLSPKYIEIVDCQILEKLYNALPNIELVFSSIKGGKK